MVCHYRLSEIRPMTCPYDTPNDFNSESHIYTYTKKMPISHHYGPKKHKISIFLAIIAANWNKMCNFAVGNNNWERLTNSEVAKKMDPLK